jgi:hypothetical protein
MKTETLGMNLVANVITALRESGIADRELSYCMWYFPPTTDRDTTAWAVDFYTSKGVRRTLVIELDGALPDAEGDGMWA